MSIGQKDSRDEEIVIVRRRSGGDEDGHHGGVWKIAYADFMTAMMAFFLVMWLVNASNRDLRRQVASYFNPLKLSDTVSSNKGLKEMQPGEKARHTTTGHGDTVGIAGEKGALTDEELFRDPSGTLDMLAKRVEADSENKPFDRPGDVLDPFHPSFRQLSTDFQNPNGQPEASRPGGTPPRDSGGAGDGQASGPGSAGPAAVGEQSAAGSAVQDGQGSWEATVQRSNGDGPTADAAHERATTAAGSTDDAARAQKSRELTDAIERTIAALRAAGPKVDIRIVPEGVLLTLTDDTDFSMFDLASAVPTPETVVFFEKLAQTLANANGSIVIAGHTDAHPFRNTQFGNWRLSTDRAHAAFLMLTRSGVAASRIERVEGYAASRPRLAEDPKNAVNRRVELLIRPE